MENPIQKFKQISIAFEKPGTFPEKLKIFTSSNYNRIECFLLVFCTQFLHTNIRGKWTHLGQLKNIER